QRQGFERFLQRPVAETVARKAGVLTLFVPHEAQGFIDLESGAVRLRRILVPVAHDPKPQAALDAAVGLGALLGASEVVLDVLHVGPEAEFPVVDAELPSGWRM